MNVAAPYSNSSHIPSGKYERTGSRIVHDVNDRVAKIVNKIKINTIIFFLMDCASSYPMVILLLQFFW